MRILLLIAAFTLTGCAGMSKDECMLADWRAIGYEDGSRGAPVSAISGRRQACAKKAGVGVDMAAYLDGRDSGLYEYCTPSNGFAAGASGQHYSGVCSQHAEEEFLYEFSRGAELHRLTAKVRAADHALNDAHAELAGIRERTAYVETALVSTRTPMPARLEYIAELKHLSEERGRIESSLPKLERRRKRAEAQLADYHAGLHH